MNIENIKIRIKIVDHKKLKAMASVNFGEDMVKGFRIYTSDFEDSRGDKLWVIPPSYQDSNGKYHPIYYTENKKRWEMIKFKIIDEYHKESEKYYKKQFDLD